MEKTITFEIIQEDHDTKVINNVKGLTIECTITKDLCKIITNHDIVTYNFSRDERTSNMWYSLPIVFNTLQYNDEFESYNLIRVNMIDCTISISRLQTPLDSDLKDVLRDISIPCIDGFFIGNSKEYGNYVVAHVITDNVSDWLRRVYSQLLEPYDKSAINFLIYKCWTRGHSIEFSFTNQVWGVKNDNEEKFILTQKLLGKVVFPVDGLMLVDSTLKSTELQLWYKFYNTLKERYTREETKMYVVYTRGTLLLT